MKQYLILYQDNNYEQQVYKDHYANCADDALLSFYRYCGGSNLFTDEELKKLCQNFGFSKLLELFQKRTL